jgi:hypothetical protein
MIATPNPQHLAELPQLLPVPIGHSHPMPALARADPGGVHGLQATALVEEARDDLRPPPLLEPPLDSSSPDTNASWGTLRCRPISRLQR